MLRFNGGFGLSLLYGVAALALVWRFDSKQAAQDFFKVYTISFKTIISLGLIIGSALLVKRTQHIVSDTIETALKDELTDDYYYYRGRFSSWRVTIRFSGLMVAIAFVIFVLSEFPLATLGRYLMLGAVCMEYGLAAYIGRKIMYAALMVHSLSPLEPKRNLFRKRELDSINTYVNAASTLTIIFVFIHVTNYYGAPFTFGSDIGQSIKLFLLLPAIIGTPVLLIFNFYPRAVLQTLYRKSIELEIQQLRSKLRNAAFNEYEKYSYVIEFEKMTRDELRYNLKMALTDLPIAITILVMVLLPLLKR